MKDNKLTLEKANELMAKNGGSLDLRGTQITALPDNLTVSGSLYLSGTQITKSEARKVRKLTDGEYVEGKYLFADGILTHVKGRRTVNGYTFYIGRIKGRNVVSDGKNYAHCNKLRDGIADLMFKTAKDRGAEQYRELTLDSVVTLEKAVEMYRVITGACRQGSEAFVQSLGDSVKDKYTVRECIELTHRQYGGDAFARFWEGKA